MRNQVDKTNDSTAGRADAAAPARAGSSEAAPSCGTGTVLQAPVTFRDGAWSVAPPLLLRTVGGQQLLAEEAGSATDSEQAEDVTYSDIVYFTGDDGKNIKNRPIGLEHAARLLAGLPPPSSERWGPFIGFVRTTTNETLQYLRSAPEVWYAEVPVDPGANWKGYYLGVRTGLETATEILKRFFYGQDYLQPAEFRMNQYPNWRG